MKILVTGSDGLVGSALRKVCTNRNNIIFSSRKDCDLMYYDQVFEMLKNNAVDTVIHTAGRVGGIERNLSTPADQFDENILINTNVIRAAHKAGIKKLIAFSSMCAFPSNVSPFTEENFHAGEPFFAHRAYAYAKRMADIQTEAYRKQYGVEYSTVIPGNIYGENDNYSLSAGHVVPSLIHKAYLAQLENKMLKVWGTGIASREFIYSVDLATIIMRLIDDNVKLPQRLIITDNRSITIKYIAEFIASYLNLSGIEWDSTKPDGQISRPSDTTMLHTLLPSIKFTEVNVALSKSIDWFIQNYKTTRK